MRGHEIVDQGREPGPEGVRRDTGPGEGLVLDEAVKCRINGEPVAFNPVGSAALRAHAGILMRFLSRSWRDSHCPPG